MKTPLPGIRDGKTPHGIKSNTSQCMESKLAKIQQTTEMQWLWKGEVYKIHVYTGMRFFFLTESMADNLN